MENKLNSHRKRPVMFKDGNLFFTKEAERRFFFIMTLIMLASGAVIKLL
jgi:hypothetical protein